LQLDVRNPVDPDAIALRTDSESRKMIVGFIPRLMEFDVRTLLERNGLQEVTVCVKPAGALDVLAVFVGYGNRCDVHRPSIEEHTAL